MVGNFLHAALLDPRRNKVLYPTLHVGLIDIKGLLQKVLILNGTIVPFGVRVELKDVYRSVVVIARRVLVESPLVVSNSGLVDALIQTGEVAPGEDFIRVLLRANLFHFTLL